MCEGLRVRRTTTGHIQSAQRQNRLAERPRLAHDVVGTALLNCSGDYFQSAHERVGCGFMGSRLDETRVARLWPYEIVSGFRVKLRVKCSAAQGTKLPSTVLSASYCSGTAVLRTVIVPCNQPAIIVLHPAILTSGTVQYSKRSQYWSVLICTRAANQGEQGE